MVLGLIMIGWLVGVASALFCIYLLGTNWVSALGVFSATGTTTVFSLMIVKAARDGLFRPRAIPSEDEADAYWAEVAEDAAWSKTAAEAREKPDTGRAA